MNELMPKRLPEDIIGQAGGWQERVAEIFYHIVDVEVEDEETARLGRLFNILMLVSVCFSLLFFATYLIAGQKGLFAKPGDVWIKCVFALLFIPLAVFCFIQVKRGHVRSTFGLYICCLLYTSPSPRDRTRSRMPSSA